jgi:hypothetical protein
VGREGKLLPSLLSTSAADVYRILLRLASVSTERRKKAGKIVELGLIYLAQDGEIEIKPLLPGMTRLDVNRPESGER